MKVSISRRFGYHGVMSVLSSLEERGLVVAPDSLALFDEGRLDEVWSFLVENHQRGGFFSEADEARILERHLYECLVITAHLIIDRIVTPEHRLVDVGSGPGLPGLLFACLHIPPQITLLDSSRRRLSWVEEFAQQRDDFASVRCCYERAEQVEERFDRVVARAFLPYPFLLEVIRGLVQPGAWVALAAGKVEQREEDAGYLQALGFAVERVKPLPELASLGERNIRVLRCVDHAQSGYPRSWPRIRREIQRAADSSTEAEDS